MRHSHGVCFLFVNMNVTLREGIGYPLSIKRFFNLGFQLGRKDLNGFDGSSHPRPLNIITDLKRPEDDHQYSGSEI